MLPGDGRPHGTRSTARVRAWADECASRRRTACPVSRTSRICRPHTAGGHARSGHSGSAGVGLPRRLALLDERDRSALRPAAARADDVDHELSVDIQAHGCSRLAHLRRLQFQAIWLMQDREAAVRASSRACLSAASRVRNRPARRPARLADRPVARRVTTEQGRRAPSPVGNWLGKSTPATRCIAMTPLP